LNQIPPFRRTRAYLGEFSTTQLHKKNPWVVAFFSFAFPGFGSLLLHRYAKAFILLSWEIFINSKAKINLGIMYSLIGQFEKAKEVLDERWLLLYVGIYMYAIWDSYRSTVDLNKLSILADREDAPLIPIKFGMWDINYLDKRKPWVAVAWSLISPGLGHLYLHKVINGFFFFGYTIAIMYFSHIPLAIHCTFVGDFAQAKTVLDMQWTLYIPSIYAFIFYDAYVSCVEFNKLFEEEQSKYLRQKYQNPNFEMPI
jgi:TM2 domain-containing membrane protein YozV